MGSRTRARFRGPKLHGMLDTDREAAGAVLLRGRDRHRSVGGPWHAMHLSSLSARFDQRCL